MPQRCTKKKNFDMKIPDGYVLVTSGTCAKGDIVVSPDFGPEKAYALIGEDIKNGVCAGKWNVYRKFTHPCDGCKEPKSCASCAKYRP